MRDASQNNTSANVASARTRTAESVLGKIDPADCLRPNEQPEAHEQDRRRDRRARQPPRDGGNAKQRNRHHDQRPLHPDIIPLHTALWVTETTTAHRPGSSKPDRTRPRDTTTGFSRSFAG